MRMVRGRIGERVVWGQLEGDDTVQLTSGMGGDKTGESVALSSMTLLAPAEPSKIVCVGRNYLDHIKELGNDTAGLPTEPGIFLKGPNALEDPGTEVAYPAWTENFHYEGELALVIGKRASDLTPENALSHVAGYTCANDLTARDKQKPDLQWFRAKAADHFCPLGPWLVPGLDPADLGIQTRLNGQVVQDSRTANMIFPVIDVLVYVSRYVTLEVGDVVLTGTPEGVGPMQPGDTVEVEVQGVGVLKTVIGNRR